VAWELHELRYPDAARWKACTAGAASFPLQAKECPMSPILLTALLALGAEDKPAAPKVDGKWLIAYAEEGGRRNNSWESRVATIKDGTLTYERDDQKNTLKLTHGEGQKCKASLTSEGGKTAAGGDYTGVCIVSQDYICLSLNPEKGGDADRGGSSGAFILILKRQR
jgi:hypothetical protein